MSVRHADKLGQVDPRLVAIVNIVGAKRDIVVLEGARSLAEEQAAILTKHSSLKDPLDSLHVIKPGTRDLALAVDLSFDPINWQDIESFRQLADLMFAAAAQIGASLAWGGNWNSFKDYDHFELHPS